MCSVIFGHPWNDDLGRDEDYVFTNPMIQDMFQQAYDSCRSSKVKIAMKRKATKANEGNRSSGNSVYDESTTPADEDELMEEDLKEEDVLMEERDEDICMRTVEQTLHHLSGSGSCD